MTSMTPIEDETRRALEEIRPTVPDDPQAQLGFELTRAAALALARARDLNLDDNSILDAFTTAFGNTAATVAGNLFAERPERVKHAVVMLAAAQVIARKQFGPDAQGVIERDINMGRA